MTYSNGSTVLAGKGYIHLYLCIKLLKSSWFTDRGVWNHSVSPDLDFERPKIK